MDLCFPVSGKVGLNNATSKRKKRDFVTKTFGICSFDADTTTNSLSLFKDVKFDFFGQTCQNGLIIDVLYPWMHFKLFWSLVCWYGNSELLFETVIALETKSESPFVDRAKEHFWTLCTSPNIFGRAGREIPKQKMEFNDSAAVAICKNQSFYWLFMPFYKDRIEWREGIKCSG